jgi:hypothetical protein
LKDIKKRINLSNFTTRKLINTKWNYRGNLSVGNFLTDFIDGNIPLVYTEGIIVRKIIIKQSKKKKRWRDDFTNGITDGINSHCKHCSLVNCEQCSSCQLQRELPTKNSVDIFQRALQLFTSQLYCWLLFFTDKITSGLKSLINDAN